MDHSENEYLTKLDTYIYSLKISFTKYIFCLDQRFFMRKLKDLRIQVQHHDADAILYKNVYRFIKLHVTTNFIN